MAAALPVVLLVLAGGVALAHVYGARRWRSLAQNLRARLEAARVAVQPRAADLSALAGVPAPVERYFRTALTQGAPIVAGVRVRHAGVFNISEGTERWRPFVSEQRVVTRRPGFDWDARIKWLPGLPVRVHDAYVAGEGVLRAALFGAFSVADWRGAGEIAEGELMRFLAEAVWYPTALLPSQGVQWEAAGERSAYATLTDGAVRPRLLFTFDATGLIESVRAEARGRSVGGRIVPTPWQGRFWNYAERFGMRVPLEGEVAWLLPEGPLPYWRGRITQIEYEFAE